MFVLEFVVILAVLIVVHELGHFLSAKALGIQVEEFGLGIPPRLATLFRWKETEFTLNAIPLGGFVRPKGENDPTVPGGLAAAPAWQRIIVLIAGPAMNLLLAVMLYAVLAGQIGIPDPDRSDVILISAVERNSPAEAAGLRVGDELVMINGQQIDSNSDAHNIIYDNLGQPVDFQIRRDDQLLDLSITPRVNTEPDQGAVGIIMDSPRLNVGIFQAISMGGRAAMMHSAALLDLVGRMITGNMPEDGRLVGLKGMYDMYSSVRDMEARQVIPANMGIISFVIELTVSLGLLNLLPIPALDGGRILFALPELLFRKRIPPQTENWVNALGFLILLALLIFFNVQDFINPLFQHLPVTPTP